MILKRIVRIFKRRRHKKAICPVCGRLVAVTANNLTWYHRKYPGSANDAHHTVDMRTGKEI